MKTYRVYFNREREWPQSWSVDEGSQATEINVVGFHIEGCIVSSHTRPRQIEESFDNSPFAWLEVEGYLQLKKGIATFTSDGF